MKPELRLRELILYLIVSQVFASSLNGKEPSSAQECLDRYVDNSQKLLANRAYCAECELVTSHGDKAMDLAFRWVSLGISEGPLKREYLEATSLHNIGIPSHYWERSLTFGDDYFYHLGPRTGPLESIKDIVVSTPSEANELFRKRKQRLVFKVPHPVVLTILPNSLYVMHDDTHSNLAYYVHRVLKQLDEKKLETGYLGTWYSPIAGLEVFFSKEQNFMPTLVRGYFLDKQDISSRITSKNFGDLQYEIRSNWENAEIGEEVVSAPTYVLNTMHKLNRKVARSRELEIRAAWKFGALDGTWLTADRLNAEISSPGFVSRLKEELTRNLEEGERGGRDF